MMIQTILISILACLALSGCASEEGGGDFIGGGTRAQFCKSGDQPVASASQCLQDDAACYQIQNNSWCTGERGASCPTGSSAIPADAACPRGARCFPVGENLNCQVNYN